MAKAVDPFDSIFNDCQAIAIEAIKNAAKKVQNEIMEEANNYLYKYYNNYHPRLYDRTYRLKRAMMPYWADKSTKDNVSIEVGVRYNSGALKGAYKSNSKYHQSGDKWISRTQNDFNFDSGDNGIPEPDWILENFLKGDHGGYQQDRESTDSLMNNFFNNQLERLIDYYIRDELFKAITRRL